MTVALRLDLFVSVTNLKKFRSGIEFEYVPAFFFATNIVLYIVKFLESFSNQIVGPNHDFIDSAAHVWKCLMRPYYTAEGV